MNEAKPKTKSIKAVKIQTEALGILNRFGKFWTHKTFETEDEARDYMKNFWGKNSNPPDMSKHKIIPVIITPAKKQRERK